MNSSAAALIDNVPLPIINFDAGLRLERLPRRPKSGTAPLSGDGTAAIEALPELSRKITEMWHSRNLNTLIHHVLLDSRDGRRQGFPPEVARELMFLAKLNVLTRAHEAAPLLGITVAEACRLIEKGDQEALGHTRHAIDIWGYSERARHAGRAAAPHSQAPHSAPRHGQGDGIAARHQPSSPGEALSPSLEDPTPMPLSVCLDLTTSKVLRHDKLGQRRDDGDVMDRSFFRCITTELGKLNIPRLVLSDLGKSQRCRWLPTAISFAKDRCHFQKVVLHCDPLSAQDTQLSLAMASGLDQLILNINLASGKWRTQAELMMESDPEYFSRQIQRLIKSRDDLAARTGHHCAISVSQINHKSVYHLSRSFRKLAEEPGLTAFRHVAESKRKENAGICHCWSPFIEAHVRSNGHLVACAQDHSGYSFTADLKQTNFSEAWHGQIFRSIRQRVLQGDKPGRLCEICPHRAARKTVHKTLKVAASLPS